jgi:hypothetical protein
VRMLVFHAVLEHVAGWFLRRETNALTAGVTELCASRSQQDFTSSLPPLLSGWFYLSSGNVANFNVLRVLSCLNSPGFRWSCFNFE